MVTYTGPAGRVSCPWERDERCTVLDPKRTMGVYRALEPIGFSMERVTERIHADVMQLAAQGADVEQIADAAVAMWRAVGAALYPIIGQRGVAALYKRSLYLARAECSCLTDVPRDADLPNDFDDLRTALALQTRADAVRINGLLLQNFTELLSSLIGASLTERLLGSVLDHPTSGHTVPETRP